MPRPVKWSRDAHLIRERAAHSRTETWSRKDIERLFDIGRVSAQALMKAIGEIQPVGGAHFVERSSLLLFLDEMIAAPSVEEGLRTRMLEADAPPRSKPLRIHLPPNLRSARLGDLPAGVTLDAGRIEIRGDTALNIIESLWALAMILHNDQDRVCDILEPPPAPAAVDEGLRRLLKTLRSAA